MPDAILVIAITSTSLDSDGFAMAGNLSHSIWKSSARDSYLGLNAAASL
jgi:hypothetical protein